MKNVNISETPEKWVVVEINDLGKIYHKVFATWAGGYLGENRWKLNSGIDNVEQDDQYYYFIGFSGSCHKCHKKSYGVVTSFGLGVLNRIIEYSDGKVIMLDDKQDWKSFLCPQ